MNYFIFWAGFTSCFLVLLTGGGVVLGIHSHVLYPTVGFPWILVSAFCLVKAWRSK